VPKLKTWRVRWEVDVDAPTARDAAVKALAIQQQNSNSIATFFTVCEWGQKKWHEIDLEDSV
jgi:hypothetical protein